MFFNVGFFDLIILKIKCVHFFLCHFYLFCSKSDTRCDTNTSTYGKPKDATGGYSSHYSSSCPKTYDQFWFLTLSLSYSSFFQLFTGVMSFLNSIFDILINLFNIGLSLGYSFQLLLRYSINIFRNALDMDYLFICNCIYVSWLIIKFIVKFWNFFFFIFTEFREKTFLLLDLLGG